MTENRSDLILKFILVTALLLVSSVYLYFLSSLGLGYSPYYGDEFFYFKNSESFAVHSSLKAAFTYGGGGSRLFGIDPHGPAYPLLYGLISKVFGWHNLNILIINFGIFLLGVFALIFFENRYTKSTLIQALLVLGSPVTLFYSITFLPELIHLGGGILLFVFCKKYLSSRSTSDFWLLCGIILVLGFFRNTWFFALIGLMVLPCPFTGYKKSIFGVMGLLLPFLFQHYLHEQVPNTFSGIGESLHQSKLGEAFEDLLFNFKRNIYFAYTYTEGWFYTLQKIWLAGTVGMSLVFYRQQKLIQFGLISLGVLVLFNVVLYKNYTWVDLRLYTPMILFLNLGMVSLSGIEKTTLLLLGLNLASFFLVIPLQYEMLHYRTNPDFKDIPVEIQTFLEELDEEYILIDSTILHDYKLHQLPIQSQQNQPIRYILPYYNMPMKDARFILTVEDDQLKVPPRNILNQ